MRKGEACLTCGKFATDATFLPELTAQLARTEQLITQRREAFRARTGQDLGADNIWLAGRRQEQDALGRIIVKLEHARLADGTIQALRGAGASARTDAVTGQDLGHRRGIASAGDCRQPRGELVDTVADNASSGLIVVGGNLRRVTDIDLRLIVVAVTRHGELVDTGAGAAVLGNPVRCVAWLANKLASFGASLHAGDVVLPGAVHRMITVAPGDVLRADFAHLGTVTARFAGRTDTP
jgi:hypothetical protein